MLPLKYNHWKNWLKIVLNNLNGVWIALPRIIHRLKIKWICNYHNPAAINNRNCCYWICQIYSNAIFVSLLSVKHNKLISVCLYISFVVGLLTKPLACNMSNNISDFYYMYIRKWNGIMQCAIDKLDFCNQHSLGKTHIGYRSASKRRIICAWADAFECVNVQIWCCI